MRRARRWWRRALTEARWLRDKYWASELDPFFQGPDPIDEAFKSARLVAWEARFEEIRDHTPDADIDDCLAERDPEFAEWLRQERRP